MASSTPWYTPSLYASFQTWCQDQSRCIAPIVADNNRRCKFGNDSYEALHFRTAAENLPPGTERDSAIRKFILLLCCERGTHRSKLSCDKYGVLTTLVGDYGRILRSKSSITIKSEVKPVFIQQLPEEIKLPVPQEEHPKKLVQFLEPYKPRLGDTVTVRDELHQDVDAKFQAVGQVYCATWPAMPGFIKIGYTGSSAVGRVADQEKCFPGIRLEASFRFDFPEKIERLLHRELLKYRHEIVICDACDRGHIEWFKYPTTNAIDIMSNWYKLTQKEPLYDSDRKLRMSWSIKLIDLLGDLSASNLLCTFSDERKEKIKVEQSNFSVIEPVATATMSELTAQLRILTDQLKSSRLLHTDTSGTLKSAPTKFFNFVTQSTPLADPEISQRVTTSDREAAVVDSPKGEHEKDARPSFLSPIQKTTLQQPKPEMSTKDNLLLKNNNEVKTVPLFTPIKPQVAPGRFPLTPPTTIQKPLPHLVPSPVPVISCGNPRSEKPEYTIPATNLFASLVSSVDSQKPDTTSTTTSLLTPTTCSGSKNTKLNVDTPTKAAASPTSMSIKKAIPVDESVSLPERPVFSFGQVLGSQGVEAANQASSGTPSIFSSRQPGPVSSVSTTATSSLSSPFFSFGKDSDSESSEKVKTVSTENKPTTLFGSGLNLKGLERPQERSEKEASNDIDQKSPHTSTLFKFSAGIPPLNFNTPVSAITTAYGWPANRTEIDGWKLFTSREPLLVKKPTPSNASLSPNPFSSLPTMQTSTNQKDVDRKPNSSSTMLAVSDSGDAPSKPTTVEIFKSNSSEMQPVTKSAKDQPSHGTIDSTHDKSTRTEAGRSELVTNTTTDKVDDTVLSSSATVTIPSKQVERRKIPLDMRATDVDQILTFFSDFMALQAQTDSLHLSSLAQQVIPVVAAMPSVPVPVSVPQNVES